MKLTVYLSGFVLSAGLFSGNAGDWTQWRGPNRDGLLPSATWPASLSTNTFLKTWRAEYGNSYSGPIVAENKVFVTESKNDVEEHVVALDRNTGREIWRTQWEGFVKVPFFANKNGNWIRSTPAYSGGKLYVAGMRDHLVCLDAETGKKLWDVDFVQELQSPVPDFGFVCSPLVQGDAVYVQAGASLVKLNKDTGKILWRALADGGGMWGSAFSSPIFATLAGTEQLISQTREALCGVDPETGTVLWKQPIKAFRGMNILTPVVHGDHVFTTAYGGSALQFKITQTEGKFSAEQTWLTKAEGYMSTPVLVDGFLYVHLRNKRFACLSWETGLKVWESEEKFGDYWSLVSDGKQILALDEDRKLHLIKANSKKFELLATQEIAQEDTWAHLAVSGEDVFIRDLKGITSFKWTAPVSNVTTN